MNKGTQFYHKEDYVFLDSKDLDIVDTSEDVWIATPKGWKCKRENCAIDYKHEHSTYADA